MSGKGSTRRPMKSPMEDFEQSWERIFGSGNGQDTTKRGRYKGGPEGDARTLQSVEVLYRAPSKR